MRPLQLLASATALLAANMATAIAQRPGAFGGSREHPAIRSSTAPTADAIAELNKKLED